MARRAIFSALSAALLSPCASRISKASVTGEQGVSAVLIAEEFGMASGGYISFDVSLEDGGRSDRNRAFYIVVVGDSTTTSWYETLIDSGTSTMDDPPALCQAPSTARFEVTESDTFNVTVTQHDLYSAYLLVCRPDDTFSGDITSTFVNLVPEGYLRQHLPIEYSMLPSLFALMAVAYGGFTVAWIGEMARLWQHVLPVHFLCVGCILVKTVEAILVAAYYSRQSKEGENQENLRLTAIVFSSLFQVVFLLTLLLFSSGWGFIRPSLRSKEGWLVTSIVGFYAGVALLEAGCYDSTSSWCSGVSLMEYAVRSFIMLSTVVAINFNITHIRFCIQLPWTSSSALEYLKLSRYLSFRMTFLAYLLKPPALLVIRYTILSWEYSWMYNAMDEFVIMLILVHLGTTFAPLDPWLLTRAFDHSLEPENS